MFDFKSLIEGFSRDSKSQLIYQNDKEIRSKVGKRTKFLWVIAGVIQLLPVLSGFALSILNDPLLFELDFFVIGLIITGILVKLLNDKSPPPPIGFRYSLNKPYFFF